jgi:hypothetical protein
MKATSGIPVIGMWFLLGGCAAPIASGARSSGEDLLQAQKGAVQKSLDSVRTARQAGDADGAMRQFEAVVRQVRAWKIGVPGGVGPAYEEEAAALAATVDVRLRGFVQAGRLLAARDFLAVHADGFGDGPAGARRREDRAAEIDELGARDCEALWKEATDRTPWFAEFAARYCAAFRVAKKVPPDLADARRRERFFRVDLKGAIAGLEPAEAEALSGAVNAAVRTTPQFDEAGAATLRMSLRGALVASERRTPQTIEHPYAMQVPYTTMEEYCEWVRVPVKVTKWIGDRQVEVTENRKQCANRTREVQQVRVVPQVLAIEATRVQRSLRLQLNLEATLYDRAFRASGSDALDESDVTHSADRPEIALAPDPLELTDRAAWLSARFGKLAADVADRLRDAWTSKHCVAAPGGPEAQAEQALRCLAATRNAPPPFVQAWSKGRFGVDAKDLSRFVP